MHRRGLLRPDHPGTWDIEMACHRPVLKRHVFLPLSSVLEVAQSLVGLGLLVLSIMVLVSAIYPTPCPPVRLGCRDSVI